MGGPDAAADRTFGVDNRYQQGVIIGNYHSECEIRARTLLEDFQHGMAAIAAAAHSIAADYDGIDALNQMDLNKIDGYFHPADPSRSLAEQLGYTPDPQVAVSGDSPTYPVGMV
jgi:hypothetical protein